METSSSRQGSVTVISVSGSVDALTAETLLAALLAETAAGNTRLVAELSGVDYASSAGLRAILTALKEARSGGGDFRLAGAQKNVMKVLELSGFTSILKIFPDLPAAVASFNG
jgi:anti-anti-sigma factor